MERKIYRCGPNDRFEVRVGPLFTSLVDHAPTMPLYHTTACADETEALRLALERVSHPTARRSIARLA